MISINDEIAKSAQRNKGGGFFSPTATVGGDGGAEDNLEGHAPAGQAQNATNKYVGTGKGSAVALPKISGRNQSSFEHDNSRG